MLDAATGEMQVFDAQKGRGSYGITAASDCRVYYASLAGNYLGQVNPEAGRVTVLEPPTGDQGAQRAWADTAGRVWISAWNTGQVSAYDPADGSRREWRLPGSTWLP